MRSALIVRNVALLIVTMFALPIALLMLIPGDMRWWQGWAAIGGLALCTITSRILIITIQPELATERSQWAKARDVPKWDRLLMPTVALFGVLLIWLAAALDRRFGVHRDLPTYLTVATLVLMLIGYGFGTWASIENRFFSAIVRIQTDRGHIVIDTGPYAIVRHPAYAGGMIGYLMIPLVLGTWWAFLPSAMTIAALCVRTKLEDEYLKKNLKGYKLYAQRVRYRLAPGIW